MTTVTQLLDSKNHKLWSIDPDKSIYDAIKMMVDQDIEALLVVDGAELLGIITERHYGRRNALDGRTSLDKVRAVMEPSSLSVSPSDTLESCIMVMIDHRARHLPVLNFGSPVGIVSIGDVVKSVIRDQQVTIDQLQTYIHGRA